MTQSEALNILKTGKNVFITGPAGSGKTYVVNQYIKYLKEHDVPVGITASTGIAATHMGGVTIHSWAGIGIKDRLTKDEINEIAEKKYINRKVVESRVLIIDEVSMLHHFRLDMIDRVLKQIKKSEEPFGGLQVVLCGDFFQLPPVSRMGEPIARFIYNSESWKSSNFVVCYLHENFRQNDDAILNILNEIRDGEISDASREELKARYKFKIESNIENENVIDIGTECSDITKESLTVVEVEPTRLYTHNIDVDSVNERELNKVVEFEAIYEMTSKGKKPLIESLKKSCLASEFLKLKKGARVMCVKNNFDEGYVNGTLGVVVSCGWNVNPVIRISGNANYPEGRMITIERSSWKIEDDGKIIAEITQYPLRLAWAITVHKSQGMSLDAIEVDLSRAFEPGMGYVALSRVRTLAGLNILGINENAFRVNHEVLEYDKHLRELSNKAESIIQYTDTKDIIQAQNEFLVKVAPLYSFGADGNKIKKTKPVKLTTYEKTAILVKEKKSIKEMSKERDMQDESIIGQIEKLLEGGKGTGDGLQLEDIQYLKKEISVTHFSKLKKALEEVSLNQEKTDEGENQLPLLGPVKSKVGPNVSWKEIRLARVLLGYVKRG